MKITTSNYFNAAKNIDFSQHKDLQEMHELLTSLTDNGNDWSVYENNEDGMQPLIDKLFQAVEKIAEPEAEPKPAKKPSMSNAKYKHNQKIVYKGKVHTVDSIQTPIFPGKFGMEFIYVLKPESGDSLIENVSESEIEEYKGSGQNPPKYKKGDKVYMFENEGDLIITNVYEHHDMPAHYDLKFINSNKTRGNISETRIFPAKEKSGQHPQAKEVHYIELKKPTEVESKKNKDKIQELIESGVSLKDIKLKLHYISSEEKMRETQVRFQQIKNRIAFDLDNKKRGITTEERIEQDGKEYRKNKKTKRPRVSATKKVGSSGEPVEHISPSVALIKRFANMHGKQVSYDKLMALLRSVQKNITEKIIRKTDRYAEEIKDIQTFLVARANENVESYTITLSEKRLEQFKKITERETKMLVVTLLCQYISIIGKTGTVGKKGITVKAKAEDLVNRIAKYEEKGDITKQDKYYNFLATAVKRMKDFISGKEKTIKPTITELNGLSGTGCDCKEMLGEIYRSYDNDDKISVKPIRALKHKSYYSDATGRGTGSHHGGLRGTEEVLPELVAATKPVVKKVSSVEDILAQEHTTVGIKGKWLELLGDICFVFYFLFYGPGGSGKSSMAISFAQYLSELGHEVLYVPAEIYGTPVLKQLLIDAGIKGNDKLHIMPSIKGVDLSKYRLVIIDSKDSAEISVDDFRTLKKKYPKTSFIFTSQGKKDGDYRGSEEWRNEVDTLVCFPEQGKASTASEKNRFGGHAEVQMFQPKQKRSDA